MPLRKALRIARDLVAGSRQHLDAPAGTLRHRPSEGDEVA
jgi:hypothetical protein